MEERRRHTRDAESELLTQLRGIVHEEVKTRTSSWPKKNGDGLLGYLGRLITPERILLVIVLIYNVGGRVQQFTTDISQLEDMNESLAMRVEDVSGQVARVSEQQRQSTETLQKQDAAIEQLRSRTATLNQQIRLTVTRGEFFEAIDQRVIPRLDRIEKAQ